MHASSAGRLRPRIGVVIPCLDDGETLPETLASLASAEPCEIVVVDDGSSDPRTLELLSELAGAGVALVRIENSGTGVARTAGLEATTAPYVFPLDADDIAVPEGLTSLADALDADPGAMLAWGELEVFGRRSFLWQQGDELDPWLITHLNTLPYAALARREALLAVGGWPSSGYEDWDLWMSFAELGWRGVHVPRVAVRYREHRAGRYSGARRVHAAIVRELEARHRPLFAARRRNWRRSQAPWRLKLVLPLIGALPFVGESTKQRLRRASRRPIGKTKEVLRRGLVRLGSAAPRAGSGS